MSTILATTFLLKTPGLVGRRRKTPWLRLRAVSFRGKKKARNEAGFSFRRHANQASAFDRENGDVSLIICTNAFGLPARTSP
jgi:hypothetical protein